MSTYDFNSKNPCYGTTHQFTDWFAPKFPKEIPEWLNILTDKDTFYQHANSRHVPAEFTNIIWQAVSYRPPDTAKRKEFHAFVKLAPTYKRFAEALRTAPKNTAGGISGLTYDIMRQWTETVIRTMAT